MLPTYTKSERSSLSDSSSLYDDDKVPDTNTTGIQVQHWSRTQADSHGVSQEYGTDFEGSSIITQPSRLSDASEDTDLGHEEVRYCFETVEDAEERRLRSALLARVITSDYIISQEHMQQVTACDKNGDADLRELKRSPSCREDVRADFGTEKIGPRPPTPPHRRPRVTNSGSFAFESECHTSGFVHSMT
jgi:hypothetical protein